MGRVGDIDAIVSGIVCPYTSKQDHEANCVFNNILKRLKL